MGSITKLPIGIENFEEIRTEGFYYVDKTSLIKELLDNWGKVNLFTRPRRFGKSLNMSMLKYFFEYGCDHTLFKKLQIYQEKELCEKFMGKFPVISITLKDASARDYMTARAHLCSIIAHEALRFQFLLESDILSEKEKAQYNQLTRVDNNNIQSFIMPDEVLENSLLVLSSLLQQHYGKKVILLIDEYDVPLEKAQNYGYYDEMIILIRNLLSKALKSNDHIYFAVLTGCLQISKESIFTGLNNLKVQTITNVQFDEYFGFSDDEVKAILHYYGFDDKYELVKEWYDGYRFGNMVIYCPWDVINYIDLLRFEPDAAPKSFWINTSGNNIIRSFIQKATQKTKRELEQLIDGGSITKRINQELTYRELYESIDNLWSVLFTTGYLTLCQKSDGDICQLVIPNLEIKQIFIRQILDWFQEDARKNTPILDAFCAAFPKADAETIEEQFNFYLKKTISIRDTSVRKDKKENFYHGILLGLLGHREDWDSYSNAESGDGFSDILLETEDEIGVVIEIKYADDGNLEAGCAAALAQIERRCYETKLLQNGMTKIIKYGIACNKKRCKVQLGSVRTEMDRNTL